MPAGMYGGKRKERSPGVASQDPRSNKIRPNYRSSDITQYLRTGNYDMDTRDIRNNEATVDNGSTEAMADTHPQFVSFAADNAPDLDAPIKTGRDFLFWLPSFCFLLSPQFSRDQNKKPGQRR